LALETLVHRVDLGNGYGVLRGDELVERSVVGHLGPRVEFEGALAKGDVLSVLELIDRQSELTATEVAEGAHDVDPHVDHEVLHL
jgi:hypothetical protein